MNGVHRVLPVLLAMALGTASIHAAEPYLEFIEGLRERGYYDYALLYLEEIDDEPRLPQDVRERIPYEKGVTLLAGAADLKNPEAQKQQLDRAQAMLEQFVQTAPNHPLRGRANTERARILLDKARVEIWQSKSPANEGNREAMRRRARELIGQARQVFQDAHDQHQAAWDKFPKSIPEDQRTLIRERAAAEAAYMQAQLDLARCTYELAQTFDEGSQRRKELLDQAVAEYQAIHERYRTQIAGLHARVWQGKCFQEQGEIRKALGIYNEILEHPGGQQPGAMQDLKDQVLRFRLICLNDPQRRDYQLVIDEATAWRQDARARTRTSVGLGITYELAYALEKLGTDRSVPENKRTGYLTQALDHARTINRYPGELKAPSGAMIQRLMVVLNRDPGDPKDFDTAFGTANQMLEETKKHSNALNTALAKGDQKGAQEARSTLVAVAAEMSRLYALALQLARPTEDPQQVNFARFRLAYGYLLQEKYYEASVLARYIARNFKEEFAEIALEAAYLALAAEDRAFFEADEGSREFERQRIAATADLIASGWPESDRANDARMALARIYRVSGQPDQAAEWYDKVPESAAQYPKAQIDAGQAYWNLYLTKATLPEGERPRADQLAQWKEQAETHLARGIERMEDSLSEQSATPDDLALAKLSLAQIRNSDGLYQTSGDRIGAIELLTEGPHAVTEAVAMPEGEERPTAEGAVKGRAIASLAYQQLLRSYIGVRDLEKARETRTKLEEIAAGTDEDALTQVYVEFGKELQKELEQLRAAGQDERLHEVRGAFEQFLNDLYQRQDGQTYNSLLWIAETYGGLGDGSKDDPAKSKEYFAKAADTYEIILSRAESTEGFVDNPERLTAVRVRLANSKRRNGDYAGAEEVLTEVLKDKPLALEAQFEAARNYQQWANDTRAEEAFAKAVHGTPDDVVWGWGRLAQRLQHATDSSRDASLEQSYFDARYRLAESYRQWAEIQDTTAAMDEKLQAAKLAIERFVAITGELPEEDYQRFNALYAEIQTELGEDVAQLPRIQDRAATAAAKGPAAASGVAAMRTSSTGDRAAQAAVPSRSSVNWIAIALLLLTLAAGIGGIYAMNAAQAKRRRERYAKLAAAGRAESKPARRVKAKGQ